MAPQGTIQVDNPTPEEIVAERRKAAGMTAAPAPSAAPGPPPSIQVSTPTGVELKGDWQTPGSSLFTPPPKTPGVDYRTPLGGPPLLSSVPESIRPYIKGGLEIGGALLAQRFAPVKAAWELPAAVRMAWMMATAGTGAAAGSVANDTLVGPPPPADLPPRAFIETPPVGSDGRPRVNIQPPLEVRTPGAPPTVGSRARAAFVAGAEGELGAHVLGGIGKQARRFLASTQRFGTRPILGAVTPEGEEVISALGENVRPSTVNPSRSVDILENVFKNSLFGGGRYKALVAEEEQAVRGYVKRLLDETMEGAQPKAATGKFWQAAQDTAEERASALADKLYDDVDALSGGVRVPLTSVKEFAQQEVERRGALGMSLAPGKVKSAATAVERASDAPDTAVVSGVQHLQDAAASATRSGDVATAKRIEDTLAGLGLTAEQLEGGLTFRQAREFRSALGRQIRMAERAGNEEARNSLGFLKQLRTRIDTAMTEAAGGPGSDLRKAFDTANDAYRTMAQTFHEGILADVAKAKPRMVVDKLIRPHEVDDIVKARKAVGDKDWKLVAATFAEDIFKTSTGELKSGEKIFDTLQKYGPETLEAVFPRDAAKDIWQVARVMKQVQRKRVGDLSWMIPTAQTTAAVGTAAAGATGTISAGSAVKGVLLMGLPSVMARIALSPTGRQLLTTGLKAKSAGDIKTATRLAGQLAAWMEKEGLFARIGKGKGGGAPAAFTEVPPQGGRQGGPGPRADGPPRVSP